MSKKTKANIVSEPSNVIPKPSNNWLAEFDTKRSTSSRVNGATDMGDLTKKPTHEKYQGDRDKYRRK